MTAAANPYGYRWRTHTLPALRTRACHECQRCGMPKRPMGWYRLLEGAHLDGDRANDNDDNLALLCRTCHRAHDYRVWSLTWTTWQRAQHERRIDEADAARPILALLRAS
jgi:hypothetical protein